MNNARSLPDNFGLFGAFRRKMLSWWRRTTISTFKRSSDWKQLQIYPNRRFTRAAIGFDHGPILLSAANPRIRFSEWTTARSGLGLAFSFGLGGHVATAVDASVDDKKHITVHKITVALDVGPIVNMSGAENQAQGASLDGLSTAMGWAIDIENGRVQQTNFNAYPIMRARSAPLVDVFFVQSDNMPSGMGEPAYPGLPPALANAIFNATGERVRQIPFNKLGYSI
jgi:isoquinoline 1-oxidoreductase beta subunit